MADPLVLINAVEVPRKDAASAERKAAGQNLRRVLARHTAAACRALH